MCVCMWDERPRGYVKGQRTTTEREGQVCVWGGGFTKKRMGQRRRTGGVPKGGQTEEGQQPCLPLTCSSRATLWSESFASPPSSHEESTYIGRCPSSTTCWFHPFTKIGTKRR